MSCVMCKKRKVRCDKGHPCENCARKQIDCVYNKNGKRRTRGPGKQRAGERIEQMTSRVAQLERVLGKLRSGGHGEKSPLGQENLESVSQAASAKKSMNTESVQPAEDGNDLDRSAARLLVKEGKSQYIRNNFWATINDEVCLLE